MWFALYLGALIHPLKPLADALCNLIFLLLGNFGPIATVWYAHLKNYSSLKKTFASVLSFVKSDEMSIAQISDHI